MTWMEVRDAIKTGKTTVIIPTGGVEQKGPYSAIGRHNFSLQITTEMIAPQARQCCGCAGGRFCSTGQYWAEKQTYALSRHY